MGANFYFVKGNSVVGQSSSEHYVEVLGDRYEGHSFSILSWTDEIMKLKYEVAIWFLTLLGKKI